MTLDDAFGHWLAGFIDGEGCFRIHQERRGDYYAPSFTLKLRDDDRAILDEIVERTGIGYVRTAKPHGKSMPQAIWHVHNRADEQKLVSLLDRFPLRAKKARDFALWREAVALRFTLKRGNRWHGPRDWTPMTDIKTAIEEGRTYRPAV